MKQPRQKKLCSGCASHWTAGVKDGKHNNWCCHFGNVATKAISVCLVTKHYEKRNDT